MDGYSEVYQLIFEITIYSNCNISGWEMYMLNVWKQAIVATENSTK